MQFIVWVPNLDGSLYENEMGDGVRELSVMVQKLKKTGKLLDGGMMADDRGGFLLMEASSKTKLESLLNSIFDPSRFPMVCHPILPFKGLKALLTQMRKGGNSPGTEYLPLSC